MTEPKDPPRPPGDVAGGGMTGATGSLTPDGGDEEFVPAERREISDAGSGRRVTAAMQRESAALHPDRGAPETERHGGPTNLAERSSGYGSEHGLSPNDPAYRMESHLPPAEEPGPRLTPGEGGEGDGDEHVEEPGRF